MRGSGHFIIVIIASFFSLGCFPSFDSVNATSPLKVRIIRTLAGVEPEEISALAFFEETNQLIVCTKTHTKEGTEGSVKIIDLVTAEESYSDNLYFSSLAVFQEGLYFYGANYSRIIAKKNNGEVLGFIPTEEPVDTIALSPDGTMLSATKPLGVKTVEIHSAYTGRKEVRLDIPDIAGYIPGSTVFTNDGASIFGHGGPCSVVYLWDVQSGEILDRYSHRYMNRSFSLFTIPRVPKIVDIALSSNGDLLATADSDERIKLWDVEKGETRFIVHAKGADIQRLFFGFEDTVLIVVTIHTVEIFDIEKTVLIHGFSFQDFCMEASLLDTENILAIGTYKGKVHLLSIEER